MRGVMTATKKAGLPRLFEIETEYEEQQVASELRFVDNLVEDIASGTLDGLDLWKKFHTAGFNPNDVEFRFDTTE